MPAKRSQWSTRENGPGQEQRYSANYPGHRVASASVLQLGATSLGIISRG